MFNTVSTGLLMLLLSASCSVSNDLWNTDIFVGFLVQKLSGLWVQELNLEALLPGHSECLENSLVWSTWLNWHDSFLGGNWNNRDTDVDICCADLCCWRGSNPFHYQRVWLIKLWIIDCLCIQLHHIEFVLLRYPCHEPWLSHKLGAWCSLIVSEILDEFWVINCDGVGVENCCRWPSPWGIWCLVEHGPCHLSFNVQGWFCVNIIDWQVIDGEGLYIGGNGVKWNRCCIGSI